jgi:hypothetical protein
VLVEKLKQNPSLDLAAEEEALRKPHCVVRLPIFLDMMARIISCRDFFSLAYFHKGERAVVFATRIARRGRDSYGVREISERLYGCNRTYDFLSSPHNA